MNSQIQSIIEGFFVYGGTSGWAYPSIVGCGENATILHYTVNNSPCQTKSFLLMQVQSTKDMPLTLHDLGQLVVHFPMLNVKSTNIVLDAQEKAIDACRVGNPYTVPHEVACRTLAEGLIRLGIITQTVEEALDLENGHLRKWYAQYWPLART